MKILVLGASGMAGHVVSQYLREHGHDVQTLSSKTPFDESSHIVDATNKTALVNFLEKNTFDVVINCVGVLVKASEERKDLASYLNGYLPHFLEYRYKDTPTKIIHLSTDCVFSGHNAPYKEDSPFDGSTFYDRSKALGEIVNDKDLTFRMSIIGPDMQENGIGLFNWFMSQTGDVSGFTKAMWNGITTIELAKGIDRAINQDLTGLYHLVSDENISKFDLLGVFKEVFEKSDVQINPSNQLSVDKTLINTRTDFDFNIPDYHTMIKEMKDWIMSHKEFYNHYEVK